MPMNLLTSEMNKCLQIYNLSMVFQEEIKCLNSPVTTEIAKSIKLSQPLAGENLQAQVVLQLIPPVFHGTKCSSYTNFSEQQKKRQRYLTYSMRPVEPSLSRKDQKGEGNQITG